MSDIKFSCPRCGQHIQCDEEWGGQNLPCPGCQTELVVPVSATSSAPPPTISSAGPAAAPAPRHTPARTAIPTFEEPKSGKLVKVLLFAVVAVVVGVGLYFGFGMVSSWQGKINEQTRKADQQGGGGQMEHIASLYEVLDATDTTRRGGPIDTGADSDDLPSASRLARLGAATRGYEPPPAPEYSLPALPATWTLDVASATIPEGRANGSLSGTNFVVDSAHLDATSQGYVMSLKQGTNAFADRELLVYLRLNPGETLPGHTWTIAKEMSGAKVPQVVKRWRPNPKFAPQQKIFGLGYAMKLELGQLEEEAIPGKIFLSLPDAEKSVLAGKFRLILPPPPPPPMPTGMGGGFGIDD